MSDASLPEGFLDNIVDDLSDEALDSRWADLMEKEDARDAEDKKCLTVKGLILALLEHPMDKKVWIGSYGHAERAMSVHYYPYHDDHVRILK